MSTWKPVLIVLAIGLPLAGLVAGGIVFGVKTFSKKSVPTKQEKAATVGSTLSTGDAYLMLVSVKRGPIQVERFGEKRTAGDFIQIAIRIFNRSDKRIVEYRSWNDRFASLRSKQAPSLTDEHGNEYFIPAEDSTYKVAGVKSGESIYPEKVVDDLLICSAPVDAATRFTLRLPRANLSTESGYLEFQFDRAAIDVP